MILNRAELLGLIEKLEDRFRTAALLQYGVGVWLKELVRLRLKDVDLERGVVTVRAGKCDKDRETLIPNCLKEALAQSRPFVLRGRASGPRGLRVCGT